MRAVFADTGNTQIHGLLGGRGSVEGVPRDEHRDEVQLAVCPWARGAWGQPARQSIDGDRVNDQDGFGMLNERECV